MTIRSWEEVANATTHGAGFIASVALLPVLILLAFRNGDGLSVAGAGVFGASLIFLYGSSTMYHALPPGDRKQLWRRIDHAAIYFLIAGTYTPFTLGALRGPSGWWLFGVVWSVAVAGVAAKLWLGPRVKLLSTLAYLVMGWAIVFAIGPLIRTVGWSGFWWLLAGGLAYTVGCIFYAIDKRVRGAHCVWHIFVLSGSICHAVAVAKYAW